MKIEGIHEELTSEDEPGEVDVLLRRGPKLRRFVGQAALVIGAVDQDQHDANDRPHSYQFLLGTMDGARACLATAVVLAMRRGVLALGLWAALRADRTETLRQIGEALLKHHPTPEKEGLDGRAREGSETATEGEGEPRPRGEGEGEQPQEDPQEGDERGPGPDGD